ncbi:MAG: helix-turn-helix transcriptional regulator [Alphaproteobacteria bacterium]|nr:helix-turn-helix transcriptional regulator [Alphaproteobacteria bacterium]
MKDKVKKSLCIKVKALRESAGLTQEDLAAKCNVSWRTISNLERGLVIPDLMMLIDIANIFNTSIDNLLDLKLAENKSKVRLEKEQFLTEKLRLLSDTTLDFVLDELILLFKYFK